MCGVREQVLAAANNPQGSGWLKIVPTIHSRHAPWEGRATEHTNEDTNGPDLLPKNAPLWSHTIIAERHTVHVWRERTKGTVAWYGSEVRTVREYKTHPKVIL